jgi:oligosaccharide repeat unit polymerase
MRVIYSPARTLQRETAPPIPVPALICGALGLIVLLYSGSWLATAMLVSYGIAVSISTRRVLKDPFEIDVMYLLYFGFYCVLPIIIAACRPDRFDQRLVNPSLVLFTWLAMFAITSGMNSPLFRHISATDLRMDNAWNPREATRVAIGLLVTGGVLLILLVQSVGLSTYLNSRYVVIYNAERGKGYLVAGIYLIEIGLLVLALSTAEFKRKINYWAFVIGGLVSLCYLRIGRRGVVMSIGVSLLIVTHFFWKPLRWKWVAILMVGGFIGFAMIGQVRAYSEQGWEGMVIAAKEDLSMEDAWSAFAESNTTQVAFREIIEYIPSQSPYRMGMSYLEGFETLIPEKFHPTRPLTSSQWFAYFYDPQVAAEGGGFAFSVFAEGYMNFGLIGVLVVAFVEGALARRFTEIRWAAPENKSRLLIVAAVATQLPYTIRGEFASLLKQNFVMVLLPTLLAAMYLGRKKAPAAARAARSGR